VALVLPLIPTPVPALLNVGPVAAIGPIALLRLVSGLELEEKKLRIGSSGLLAMRRLRVWLV
jgi:hypothetical protein